MHVVFSMYFKDKVIQQVSVPKTHLGFHIVAFRISEEDFVELHKKLSVYASLDVKDNSITCMWLSVLVLFLCLVFISCPDYVIRFTCV